ncbi:replication initiation protein (plasmid) [Yersinia similis]|uniref:Replication initiation protein n=1 Tax=Yersinia similis TaxID=367190 RepID=A0ABM5Q4N5_9GAMM|nr:plasmid replication initiator RepA [Yersinia similis]AHK22060.1 replication initiation protein [Yersinia similis]
MTKKHSENLSIDPSWENINLDALERAATDDTYWQWIDEPKTETPSKTTKRRRGEHSTACKCPNPFFSRPEHYKPLAGELGHAYRRLTKKDKHTGKVSLRIRISRHPYFVWARKAVGRQRDFRVVREQLLDALFVLLVSCADRATHIVTMNESRLAAELSPKDENGNVIPTTAVTVTRICRLLQELNKFGLIALPEGVQWDAYNKKFFPKHIILTEQAWKLIGVNLDKLYAEQEERLQAELEGILQPGEDISVKTARKRWYDRMRHATLVRRRGEAIRQKRANRLGKLELNDRVYEMSHFLQRTLSYDELYHMTPERFEKLVWQRLHQLDIGLAHEPPDPYH